MLQGRLTDGHGRTVECKEAIFGMTANLASEEIANHVVEIRRQAARAAENDGGGEKLKHSFHRSYIIVCNSWCTALTVLHPPVEVEQHIKLSREFKENVVEPILKVLHLPLLCSYNYA